MNTNRKYLYFGIAAILLTIFFALLFGKDSQKIDWNENYLEDNKGPFGSFLAIKLLETYFPDKEVNILKDSIAFFLDKEINPANYVFIGEYSFMDSISENALLEFVSRGNRAFIASNQPPLKLMESIFHDYCTDFDWSSYLSLYSSTVSFNFSHSSLSTKDSLFQVVFENDFRVIPYSWNYFSDSFLCNENNQLVEVGKMNDSLINFIKIDYGYGSFHFHTTPILFTNSILKKDTGLEYAHRSFAHLQEGEIYWDKHSQIWEFNNGNWWNSKKTLKSDGPLKYILAQPSLAWAWYITLALGLLYLLFRAKRQQRIIPVLDTNRNTSLEFISTIGRMYFIQNNHRKLALKKIKLFLIFVRERYKIPTQNLDDTFMKQLVAKSEVSPDLLQKILKIQKNIKNSNFLSENMLIEFHKLLDHFYKKCK